MSKETFGPSDLKTHFEKNGRSCIESDILVYHFWPLLKNEDLNKSNNLDELEKIFWQRLSEENERLKEYADFKEIEKELEEIIKNPKTTNRLRIKVKTRLRGIRERIRDSENDRAGKTS